MINKKLKTILIFFEWIVLTVVVCLFILVISPALPFKTFLSSYVVVSSSMEPFIPKGSLVFLKAENGQLLITDIVGFQSPKDKKVTIIHRISDIQYHGLNEVYLTKGDNNENTDPWALSKQHITGRYVGKIPYIGYVTNYVKTPKGFALAIGIPALILMILQFKTIKEGFDEEVEHRARQRLVTTISND
jgi:signal peptidase I